MKLFTVYLWSLQHGEENQYDLVETYGVLDTSLTQVVNKLKLEYKGANVSFRNELARADVALLLDQAPHGAHD